MTQAYLDEADALSAKWTKPFHWRDFLIATTFGGAATTLLLALILDTALIELGVPLRFWTDAWHSGAGSAVLFPLGVIGVWKLGVIEMRHHILAAMVLFGPATIIVAAIVALMEGQVISAPDVAAGGPTPQEIAFIAYVRIARSAFLVPPSILAFFYIYHHIFRRRPRGR